MSGCKRCRGHTQKLTECLPVEGEADDRADTTCSTVLTEITKSLSWMKNTTHKV